MTFIYMLSDYGEYGSDNVVATLDKSIVAQLLMEHWPHAFDECIKELARLLDEDEEKLAKTKTGHDLEGGWGGVQLHIIELSS